MDRRPYGVLDTVAALLTEHASVYQLVEYGADLTQGRAVLPGRVVRCPVGVLVWQGERGVQHPKDRRIARHRLAAKILRASLSAGA